MPCETIRDANGRVIGIACSRGSRRKRCKCGRQSTKLCDFPLKGHLRRAVLRPLRRKHRLQLERRHHRLLPSACAAGEPGAVMGAVQ
jgi:hypothetical protein